MMTAPRLDADDLSAAGRTEALLGRLVTLHLGHCGLTLLSMLRSACRPRRRVSFSCVAWRPPRLMPADPIVLPGPPAWRLSSPARPVLSGLAGEPPVPLVLRRSPPVLLVVVVLLVLPEVAAERPSAPVPRPSPPVPRRSPPVPRPAPWRGWLESPAFGGPGRSLPPALVPRPAPCRRPAEASHVPWAYGSTPPCRASTCPRAAASAPPGRDP